MSNIINGIFSSIIQLFAKFSIGYTFKVNEEINTIKAFPRLFVFSLGLIVFWKIYPDAVEAYMYKLTKQFHITSGDVNLTLGSFNIALKLWTVE